MIPQRIFKKEFSNKPLIKINVILSGYSGEKIVPLGEISVEVNYSSSKQNFEFLVVDTTGPALIGRDWINKLKLQIRVKSIFTVSNAVESLIAEFPEVFFPGLGRYRGPKVKLELNKEAKSIFCKPRALSLIFKERIKKELERLEKEGIITRVQDSVWGTPLVPVLKRNGQVRICADYKRTVNPFLKDVKYPLPRIEEIFAKLEQGKEFSKLDLSQAYNQLELEKKSKMLLA